MTTVTTWKPTSEEYHADTAHVSHSMLKQFRTSRRDYHAIFEVRTKAKREPSDEMNLGTALHCAVLEPEDLHKRIAFAPECDRRTKDGKVAWSEFQAESAGKLVLPWSSRNSLDLMLRAVQSNGAAMALLERAAERESSIRWQDAATGLALKSRLDAMIRSDPMIIVDLKTTRGPSPSEFARAMATLGYHTQAAFYVDGCRNVYHCEPRFVFIAVANCDPFSCAVYEIDRQAIDIGHTINRRALTALAECRETDDFREPWEKAVNNICLPKWAEYQENDWRLE